MTGEVTGNPAAVRANSGPWFDLVRAMENWEPEIMACFDYPLTNAFTQSTNRISRDLDRGGRGNPVLQAKSLYGQEFRKRSTSSSLSSRSRD